MKKVGFEAVEAEIQREKAEALGRTGDRLEWTFQQLERLRQEIMRLALSSLGPVRNNGETAGAGFGEKLAQYARLREQAKQLRYCLIVQREAVGLRRHDDVDRLYPMPPPLTLSSVTRREDGR